MNIYAKMDNNSKPVCTDGAALMTGKVKEGFKAKVRQLNPEIRFDRSPRYHSRQDFTYRS
jgi:hypothetical protein